MQLTVLVENFCQNQKLKSEWGYCLWLESEKTHLLLDTGGYNHALEHNARVMGLDWKKLTDVVLSHSHFDHTAGLLDVVRLAPQAKVWGGKGFSKQRWSDADQARNGGGGKVLAGVLDYEIDTWAQVTPEVIAFRVPEEYRDPRFVNTTNMWEETDDGRKIPDTFTDDVSLLVSTAVGTSLILGCAHAGLPNIMDFAVKTFGLKTFETVLGGTHLCSATPETMNEWMQKLQTFDVKRWRPNHCTGFPAAAKLAQTFSEVQWAGCGTVITI